LSTTDDAPRGPPAARPAEAYVSREVCDAFRQEQREANSRTWQELRSLRRLVILLVVGGQLFGGGLNVAGFAYWIDRHAAHPHASTLEMLADARAETREDLRDLRREIRDLAVRVLQGVPADPPPAESDPPEQEPAQGDRP